MRHISCARSRSRRWATALVAASTRSPAGTLLGSSQSRLRVRQKLPGKLLSQKLLHLLPPAHIPSPLTHRHALGPAQAEPDLLLLALPREMGSTGTEGQRRSTQCNQQPRPPVLLMDCSSRIVACTRIVFSVANPSPTCLPQTL